MKSDFSHGKEFPWKIKASPLKIPDRRRSEELDAIKNMGRLMIELGKNGRLFFELINIYTLGVISKEFWIFFCILGWCPWFLCDTFFSLHKPALWTPFPEFISLLNGSMSSPTTVATCSFR